MKEFCSANPSDRACYRHDALNDARLNWETFNSPNLFGLFRSDGGIVGGGFAANFTCHEPIDFPTISKDKEECLNWLEIFDMSPIGGYLPNIPLNSDYWNTTFVFDERDMEQIWHPMVQWDDNRCRSIYPDEPAGCFVLRNQTEFEACEFIVHNRMECPGIEWVLCDMTGVVDLDAKDCTDREFLPPELDRSGFDSKLFNRLSTRVAYRKSLESLKRSDFSRPRRIQV